MWGVEYYNTGCVRAGYPDTMQPIDDLLHLGKKVFPLAADDAHAGKDDPRDCFGGFVMVKTDALEYGKVMTALEKGDFYASSGPAIEEMYLEDGVLHIKTSPAAKVEVITERRNRWCRRGEGLTELTFDLSDYINTSREVKEKRCMPYFRVTVTDATGETAQSRPYTEEDWG